MDFLLEITKIWQQSRDFGFPDIFLEIFKIYRLIWIFLCIFGCFDSSSSMFCLRLLIILNLTNTVFQNLRASEAYPICIIGWCFVSVVTFTFVRQRNP